MGYGSMAFWLFLAAVSVAGLTFVTIVVWAENRLQERKEFYRFEFRKRLIEAGKMDATSAASLARYEHELRQRQGRQKLLVAALVFLGIGVGACVGLLFLGNSIWMLGFIPIGIGLGMLLGGLLFAGKSDPGPPPSGYSPEST